MPGYNPIVRTFNRVRRELLQAVDVPRQLIRPDTRLETLLPVEERRELWQRLQKNGLDLPGLQYGPDQGPLYIFGVLVATVLLAMVQRMWFTVLSAIPTLLAARRVTQRLAIEIPGGLETVGQMTLYLISFREHKDSGYRWTGNEISTKVRFIIAESLGVSFDKIRPEHSFADDMGIC